MGFTQSIIPVAYVLGVSTELSERTLKAVEERISAIEKCKAAKNHWQPKKLDPNNKKPKCHRCGARVDVDPGNDPGIAYRVWCEMLEGFRKGVTPGRLPTEQELRDAGFYQPDHAVPAKIKPPHSVIWHPVIILSRHDNIGLAAAMRLARATGALPNHGPDVPATSQNEAGRRWSF